MFAALLLVATLGQVAPAPFVLPADASASTPAGEWRTFTANPTYEIFGHMDPSGAFLYTRSRKKAAPKKAEVKKAELKNFGVDLPKHEPILTALDFEVRGTDKALGHEIAEAAVKVIGTSPPCPGPGPCPDRTPKPAPRPHVLPPLPSTLERDALCVVVVVALAAIVCFGVLALVLTTIALVIRAAWRFLTAPVPDRV